jgi:protein disulfide-isomerase
MRTTALAILTLVIPAIAQESSWLTDFEAAKATATKDAKVILADFTGSDWCGWCKKLEAEVFDTPEFRKWAGEKVVLLKVDFPRKTEQSEELQKQNKQLAEQYGIRGFPTILFLDAEGKQLGQLGYKAGGPANWIQLAEAQMKGPEAAEEGAWMTDYKAALTKARKEKKRILVDFTGSDWCGWCKKLKAEVFDTPEFAEWAKEHVILLEIDFPRAKPQSDGLKKQNKELEKEYRIQGYPTILFLDAKGNKVGQMGYAEGGPDAWLPLANKELGIKTKKKKAKR